MVLTCGRFSRRRRMLLRLLGSAQVSALRAPVSASSSSICGLAHRKLSRRLVVAEAMPEDFSSKLELWVWNEIHEGRVADLKAQDEGKVLDPKQKEGWHGRWLSHDFLSKILFCDPYRSLIPASGVRIVGACFPFGVTLAPGRLEKQLRLEGCRFEGALEEWTGLRIEGALSLKNSAFCGGYFKLSSVQIDDDLDISDAFVEGTVRLEGVKVGGNLDISGSTFNSSVSFSNINIGGNLKATSAKLGKSLLGNLIFEEVNIERQLLMEHVHLKGFSVSGAKVGGQFRMSKAQFSEDMLVSHLTVMNDVIMDSVTFGERATVAFSNINGTLYLSGSKIKYLDLSATIIKGELRLGRSAIGNPNVYDTPQIVQWEKGARLDLRNGYAGTLQDHGEEEGDAWPTRPNSLWLDGFTYDRLGGFGVASSGAMLARSTDWYIGWLARNPSSSPQPYRQLANVFQAAGAFDKANAVLFALRERERVEAWRHGQRGRWLGLWALRLVIGYGIGTGYFNALLWVGLFTMAGFAVLWSSSPAEGIVWCAWASLDEILPFVELNKNHTELINKTLSGWGQAYFYLHRVVGYVLGSFVIAGLVGLTQGSRAQGK
jgi:hypothetical protein